ncbi:MAG: sensor histidine kinase [Wolinella sp.]
MKPQKSEEESLHYQLFDSHDEPKAIFRVDARGAYVECVHLNKKARKLLGITQVKAHEGAALFARFFGERLGQSPKEGIVESSLHTEEGEFIILNLAASEESEHIREAERNKMIRMGEMIGAITHQWRQPLSSIKLMAQDLLEAYHFNEITQEYLKEMGQNVSRHVDYLSQTIEDFRNFYKDDQLTHTLELGKIIADSLKIAEPQIRMQEIRMHFECDETFLVKGKQNELIQVFLNLISNAQDALLNKSKAKGKFLMEIRIKLTRIGNQARVLIMDNGEGVSEEARERIFDPHYSTRKERESMGIGLSLVKRILNKDFNASIALINPAEWTEFELIFPIAGR